jgi:hypothetical protein
MRNNNERFILFLYDLWNGVFSRILVATSSIINMVCTATKSRSNLHPVILGAI